MTTWYDGLNSKYGISSKAAVLKNGAKDFFGKLVEPGKAVVSVISATGIAGFKFHVPQSEEIKFESDITDHYTDENEAFQDHIALKPIIITLTGYQGDYFYTIHPIESAVALVTPTLKLVQEYIPKFSAIVQQIKGKPKVSELVSVDKAGNPISTLQGGLTANKNALNAVDLFKFFQNIYKFKSAQARAFFYLEALWKAKTPFSVETSWKRYDNMVIQSLVPKRDGNADITDFSVTFKQVNFAATQVKKLEGAGRKSILDSDVIKKIDKGEEVSPTKGENNV